MRELNDSLAVMSLEVLSALQLRTIDEPKGFMALVLHCPGLWHLCIHFQVASFGAPLASLGIGPNTEPTGSWTDCALTDLSAGEIAVPEELALMVAQTLLHIFPRITYITSVDDEDWDRVYDAMQELRLSE